MEYLAIKRMVEGFSRKTYISKNESKEIKEKTMLMVSHTLERGGAPLVLLELVSFFQQDYNIIFISMQDGELRKEYLEQGLDIFIGNSVDFSRCGYKFWENFDLVFLNTIITHTYLPLFINRKMPVLWWLHEPEMLFRNTYGCIPHLALFSPNIKVLSVTDETASCVRKYYGVESKVLHMGLVDRYKGDAEPSGRIRFFMPAKFQMIKGQDILAQAILDLPSEYQAKAEFIFAGPKDVMQPEYYELISKLSIGLESVTMLGEITKEEVYDWYEKVDCVLAPSRADATPTTIVEGMMFNKLCACSTATGISRYMISGRDGYVFPAGDSFALRELIIYIIDHYVEMDDLRANGRKIYLEHFERSAVEKALKEKIVQLGEE